MDLNLLFSKACFIGSFLGISIEEVVSFMFKGILVPSTGWYLKVVSMDLTVAEVFLELRDLLSFRPTEDFLSTKVLLFTT